LGREGEKKRKLHSPIFKLAKRSFVAKVRKHQRKREKGRINAYVESSTGPNMCRRRRRKKREIGHFRTRGIVFLMRLEGRDKQGKEGDNHRSFSTEKCDTFNGEKKKVDSQMQGKKTLYLFKKEWNRKKVVLQAAKGFSREKTKFSSWGSL